MALASVDLPAPFVPATVTMLPLLQSKIHALEDLDLGVAAAQTRQR